MLTETVPRPSRSNASARSRAIAIAAKCLALLVVPLLGWLFFAPRGRASTPPEASAGAEAAPDSPRVGGTSRPQGQGRLAAPTKVEPPVAPGVGGVEGEVLDPGGKPAADATVSCRLGERELEAKTDGSGQFRLAKDAAGCEATATKRGFAASAPVTLAAAGNRLRLSPPTGIAGQVVDEGGAPLSNYGIAVESVERAGGAADAGRLPSRQIVLEINDAQGAFEWDDLAPGRYGLAVSVMMRPFARARGVEVRAGAVTRGVRIVVNSGVTVVGRVMEAKTDRLLDGSFVFVENGLDLGLKMIPGIAQAGEFTLQGAPREGFDLHVLHPGYHEGVVRGLKPPANGEPLRVDIKLWRGDEPYFDGGSAAR